MAKKKDLLYIGWQEWLSLPDLKLPAIKTKIDTGARTSSLHAFDMHIQERKGRSFVSFKVHPLQARHSLERSCLAELIDIRSVMSSNGHREERPVILTHVCLGGRTWEIELTLSNRDPLRFRMLLGRQALSQRVAIDPSKRLCLGSYRIAELRKLYNCPLEKKLR